MSALLRVALRQVLRHTQLPRKTVVSMPNPTQTVGRMLEIHRQGSTLPALVETEKGERFVLKLAAAGPGPRALLSELIVNGLAPLLGVSVPAAQPLYLPPGFPWQVGTDEYDQMLQASFGWNLGIEWIPKAEVVTAKEVSRLPEGFLSGVATLDRLFQNVDRSASNLNLLRDSTGALWAIDHGTCLFLERIAAGRRTTSFELPRNHFLAGPSARADPIDLPLERMEERVNDVLKTAPEEWFAAFPFDADELARRLVLYMRDFCSIRSSAGHGRGHSVDQDGDDEE